MCRPGDEGTCTPADSAVGSKHESPGASNLSAPTSRQTAFVLLGPTGAGKSPLGDMMAERGLAGRACAHFDFGHRLRRVAQDVALAARTGLSEGEQETVRSVLRDGALLEEDAFGIALKILDGFTAGRDRGTVLVMNGLPRHLGQARRLDTRLNVERVILLECAPEEVMVRIRCNRGGDRTGRSDDAPSAVRRRLALYRERTEPLAAYYETAGARLMRIPVREKSTAEAIYRRIVRACSS